ncbi:UNVERIFIED_CONTAM: hypothetical protein HDU68_007219 [Siphonaria sp. JEL0065]|nr:hypothetical protein HDU68_007219 [Siphonaria sp. JEL0065]
MLPTTGFYNDLMLDQFAIENKHILFAHAAPGIANTNWGTEMPWAIRQLLKPLKVFAKSPEDCAALQPFDENALATNMQYQKLMNSFSNTPLRVFGVRILKFHAFSHCVSGSASSFAFVAL